MKTVIVTGASRGIGKAICRDLRVKGVRVIGVARRKGPLEALSAEKIGTGPMEFVVGDVTDASVAEAAIKLATKDGHYTLDALILNAAVLGPVKPTIEADPKEVAQAFNVNVISTISWVRAAMPALCLSKGRVIITSSLVAVQPYAGFATYCATKAAVNMMVSVFAAEEKNVTFMAVAPGIVKTELFDEFQKEGRKYMTGQQAAFMASLEKNDQLAKVQNVANGFSKLALFAPADQSGRFMNWDDAVVQKL